MPFYLIRIISKYFRLRITNLAGTCQLRVIHPRLGGRVSKKIKIWEKFLRHNCGDKGREENCTRG